MSEAVRKKTWILLDYYPTIVNGVEKLALKIAGVYLQKTHAESRHAKLSTEHPKAKVVEGDLMMIFPSLKEWAQANGTNMKESMPGKLACLQQAASMLIDLTAGADLPELGRPGKIDEKEMVGRIVIALAMFMAHNREEPSDPVQALFYAMAQDGYDPSGEFTPKALE